MPQNNPMVIIDELLRRRATATSERAATAATELIWWYYALPLRRVRKLVEPPASWYDQCDYPPIAEIIGLYEAFLVMTDGQEEPATYTLDILSEGILALYVVEAYVYAEYRSNLMIREERWFHLFTSRSEYQQKTSHDPLQDRGSVLTVHPENPTLFSIHGFTMSATDKMQRASYYRKTWYQASQPERVIRQERYCRRANRLVQEAE